MKKLYFLVVMLFVMGSVKGQNPDDIVVFTDINFKNILLQADDFSEHIASTQTPNFNGDVTQYTVIDTNNDSEIQYSEAQNITYLDIYNSYITNTTGLEAFTNLITFKCSDNEIEALDVSALTHLEVLYCNENDLTSLDVNTLSSLRIMNCDTNQITTLDLSGLANLTVASCSFNYITTLNLTGLSSIKNLYCGGNNLTSLDIGDLITLKNLDCSLNQFTTLEVSTLVNLEALQFRYNQIESIDLTGLDQLVLLNCENNLLTSLDLSSLTNLMYLYCSQNQLTTIDLSHNHAIQSLEARNNQLISILLKNGSNAIGLDFYFNPNLSFICANDSDISAIQELLDIYEYTNCLINSYCSFTPGGTFYTIEGSVKLNGDTESCDDAVAVAYPNLKLAVSSSSNTGIVIANGSGDYFLPVTEGAHTITPIIENPAYFNISPATTTVTFPETTSPFTQNFCITPNGLHPDLEVAILPTTPARPGFYADYKLIIKNKGNIPQSGSVSFAYDDTVLDYIIAAPLFTTQAEGSLSWDFANLEPFETREINVTLNVNSPMETPAVNGDDVLTYTATITSEATDELPLDNVFTLPQIVVNSFDPNDKTCLEGTAITPDMIGQYVHYMIRFENTGTFAAQNIVVKDMIDTAKFDVSSLVALNGSHPYVTRITGNKVEFIFEGINLPFDDANNDGYVVFKIKTLPTLVLGNSFSNTASIYFDFNYPIVTEPAITTFAVLKTKDFEFNDYFTLYPNPTSGILNITSKQAIELQSISIYNVLGQMVVSIPNAKGVNSVDVSSLSTGNYFIKIVSDKGTSNTKFIKQ